MKITLEDVIEFIIKNSEQTEWMDKINKITYPFTSKFKSNTERPSYKEHNYKD